MKREFIAFSGLWFFLFAFSVALYVKSEEEPRLDSFVAITRETNGSVRYRPPFSSVWRRVSNGMQFAAGTAISTQTNAKVILETNSGDILRLSSESQIVLSALDRVQRAKSMIFLVNGTLSVKPDAVMKSSKGKLSERFPNIIGFLESVSAKVNTTSEVRDVLEVAVGNLRLDVTESSSPIVIASMNEKVHVLANDKNVVARQEGKDLGSLPSDKAITLESVGINSLISEIPGDEKVDKLRNIARETEHEVRQLPADRVKLVKTDSRIFSNLSGDTALELKEANSVSPTVRPHLVPKDLPQSMETQGPARYKKVTDQPPPATQPSEKADEHRKTNIVQPQSRLSLSTPVPRAANKRKVEAIPTPRAIHNLKVTSTPGPLNNLWQLVSPLSGIEVLSHDQQALSSLENIIFKYKYVGPTDIIYQQPTLEIFDQGFPEVRVILTSTADGSGGFAEFDLAGTQFSKLVYESKGRRKFSFRIRLDDEVNGVSRQAAESQTIELKAVEELAEGGYVISTRKYQLASSGEKFPTLFIGAKENGVKSDGIRFFAATRSALKILLSKIAFGPSSTLSRSDPQPTSLVGTHFVEGQEVIFSIYPSKGVEEFLKLDWLSTNTARAVSRAVFEGKSSDFIRPDSIPVALRESDSRQSLQFVAGGELFKTKVGIFRIWPGAARRLSLDRIPLFRVDSALKTRGINFESEAQSQPPSSFQQNSKRQSFGNIVTILIDGSNKFSFPSLEQIGFSAYSLFESHPKRSIENVLMEKGIRLDGRIRESFVAKGLFDLIRDALNLSLLMVVSEKSDGVIAVEIVGRNSSGNTISRTFAPRGISELQGGFFSSLDYDGVIVAAEKNWLSITSQNIQPVKGQWAAVYSRVRQDVWLPVFDRNEAPSALIQCEVVQPRGCWARVITLDGSRGELNLTGAMSKWL